MFFLGKRITTTAIKAAEEFEEAVQKIKQLKTDPPIPEEEIREALLAVKFQELPQPVSANAAGNCLREIIKKLEEGR